MLITLDLVLANQLLNHGKGSFTFIMTAGKSMYSALYSSPYLAPSSYTHSINSHKPWKP